MSFADALQDTATFYSITTSSGDIGDVSKAESVLYLDVPCRLHAAQSFSSNKGGAGEGSTEKFVNMWNLLVESDYNGASRGDKVVINGENYLITRKHEIMGDSSAIHHVTYYLTEYDG